MNPSARRRVPHQRERGSTRLTPPSIRRGTDGPVRPGRRRRSTPWCGATSANCTATCAATSATAAWPRTCSRTPSSSSTSRAASTKPGGACGRGCTPSPPTRPWTPCGATAGTRPSAWRRPAKPPPTARPTACRRRWRGATRSRSTRPPVRNRPSASAPPSGRLPDFLRQVLILAYYQGLKYREVADVLGIPVGTVKSRLHAALVKLQEAMAATTAVYEA